VWNQGDFMHPYLNNVKRSEAGFWAEPQTPDTPLFFPFTAESYGYFGFREYCTYFMTVLELYIAQ